LRVRPAGRRLRGLAAGRCGGAGRALTKPYSVSAVKAMGTVEMKQPAMGMKEQMKTNSDSRPTPGMASAHMPAAVSAVLTSAMRACARGLARRDAEGARRARWAGAAGRAGRAGTCACSALPNSWLKTATEGATSS